MHTHLPQKYQVKRKMIKKKKRNLRKWVVFFPPGFFSFRFSAINPKNITLKGGRSVAFQGCAKIFFKKSWLECKTPHRTSGEVRQLYQGINQKMKDKSDFFSRSHRLPQSLQKKKKRGEKQTQHTNYCIWGVPGYGILGTFTSFHKFSQLFTTFHKFSQHSICHFYVKSCEKL